MIHISNELISEIKTEAEKPYPNECCGFIFGNMSAEEKTAVQIIASENTTISGEQYHRFVISPVAMLKAERYARQNGLDIVGFYHSHPDCKAVPSEFDTLNALPVYSYIIVSAEKGRAAELRSWVLDKKSNYTKFQGEIITTIKER